MHALVSVASACPTFSNTFTFRSLLPTFLPLAFFPESSSKGEANVICKFFEKSTMFRLMKKCNGEDQVTKCWKNLHHIFSFLGADLVNTSLDVLDEIQIQIIVVLRNVVPNMQLDYKLDLMNKM